MTLTINLPDDVGTALAKKAKTRGRDSAEYVEELVKKEVTRPSLDKILVPIRADFKKSGMTELELETFIDDEIKAMRAEKRRKANL